MERSNATLSLSVVHFLWWGEIGGIERIVSDLTATQISQNLCRPTILLGTKRRSEKLLIDGRGPSPIVELGLASGFDVSPRKVLKALAVFRSHDIIHLHAFNPAVALAAVLSGRPIVFTEHGPLGGAESNAPWSRLKRFLFSFFVTRCVTVVTCNSEYTKARVLKYYGLRATKCEVVYNGTKPDSAQEPGAHHNFGLSSHLSGRFVVGTFSRLVPEKRIDRLLEAVKELSDPRAVSVLIVGGGPAESALKSLVERLDLSTNVYFVGAQVNVSPFIAQMELCVFPAESEPFGLVALEALAAGKPTLVFSDGGGLVEIIEPLASRDVVGTVKELAGRIDHYRKCPQSEADSDKRKAYALTFNIERTARAFMALYLRIAARK